MIIKELDSYWVWIYIAGDRSHIEQICREYVLRGLCVTVEDVKFIYTYGEEFGVRIGLINYPRFPVEEKEVWNIGLEFAKVLKEKTFQRSVLIIDKYKTKWISEE